MKTLKMLLACLLVMMLAWPTAAMAKDTAKAGKVTAVSGTTEVKKSGGSKKFKAFKGMAITQGDTIVTGSGGKLVMDLDSDKEVTIGSGTTLVVSELVQSAKALNGKTSLSLLKGKVVIKIKKKLDGDSRFEIETPTAIMGVMGTEFVVLYEEEESYVGVFEGKVRTSFGGKREEVDPDQQLWIDKRKQGETEPLDYRDLPVIGLEHYADKLKQDPNANQALLDQVMELLSKKKAEEAAAAAANNGVGTPANRAIVYEDTVASGSGSTPIMPTASPNPTPTTPTGPTPTVPVEPTPTVSPDPTPTVPVEPTPTTPTGPTPTVPVEPTPTVSPDPTPTVPVEPTPTTPTGPTPTVPVEPTPTVSPDPTPTVAPKPPLLDNSAFYEHKADYMISDSEFILPFSHDLAWAPSVDGPSGKLDAAYVELYNVETHQFEKLDWVEDLSIDPNQPDRLRIKLSEGVSYGSRISFTVREGYLANANTGDVLEENQTTVSPQEQKGFHFLLNFENREFSFTQYGEQENQSFSFHNLGYHVSVSSVSKACPEDEEDEGNEQGNEEEWYDESYCNQEEPVEEDIEQMLSLADERNQSVLTFNASYFNHENRDAATYEFIIRFEKLEQTVTEESVYVTILPANPPELVQDNSYMLTLDSYVLEFTEPLKLAVEQEQASDYFMLQRCGDGQEGCFLFPGFYAFIPFPQPDSVEIESVQIDPANERRLIVQLKDELDYYDTLLVGISGGLLKNKASGVVQQDYHTVRLQVRGTAMPDPAEFTKGMVSPADDVTVKLNTLGLPYVKIEIYKDFSTLVPETAYELAREEDVWTIKLFSSYFAAEAREIGTYTIVVRFYDSEEAYESEWEYSYKDLRNFHIEVKTQETRD